MMSRPKGVRLRVPDAKPPDEGGHGGASIRCEGETQGPQRFVIDRVGETGLPSSGKDDVTHTRKASILASAPAESGRSRLGAPDLPRPPAAGVRTPELPLPFAADPLRRLRPALTLIGIALAIHGCAGAGTRVTYRPPEAPAAGESARVEVPLDHAWQAVVDELFDRNVPVRTLEKESGLVETAELAGEIGRDCDCGSVLGVPVGGYLGAYGGDAFYSFRVRVRQAGDASEIAVRSTCRGSHPGVEGPLACRLSPERERDLLDSIAKRVEPTRD